MYDINKRVELYNTTVGKIIDELMKLPKDAVFYCCGDNKMYIHVESDNSVVSIDTEDLDEDYIDDPDTDPDDYWEKRKETEDVARGNVLSKTLCTKINNIRVSDYIVNPNPGVTIVNKTDEPICDHPEGDIICE